MTREEAIAIQKAMRDNLHETGKDYPYRDYMIPLMKESCDIAIQALEQEPIHDILDKIRAEIEEKYGNYDICEWFEDYDYEETDISEYRSVGDVSDILAIIDKYKAEGSGKE